MGERVAHLISGQMIDYIELVDGFAIAKIHPPAVSLGKSLAESGGCDQFGGTVMGIKCPGEDFQHATPNGRVQPGDLLLGSRTTSRVEKFAGRATR
jgi:trk system potassium uptake protein TrkA